MRQIGSEKIKLNLARLKKASQNFEISVDPDLAVRFKKGELIDLREILKAEQIFSDAKKGELVPLAKLKETFQTTDPLKIAEIIIKEGEIQLTSEYRAQKKEQKKRKLIEIIHCNAVDPSTKLPHPPQRIELAFQEAKIQLDEFKSAEEQLDSVLAKLRPILPLKFEQAKLTLKVPPSYAPKSYPLIQKYSKILKEAWNSDGSWTITLEIPAGLKVELLDKLNSLTHGEIIVFEEK